jgi:hypothetical protein
VPSLTTPLPVGLSGKEKGGPLTQMGAVTKESGGIMKNMKKGNSVKDIP